MPIDTIRTLTPDYAVSPQIDPEDMAAIREAGFVAVICNRPDAEVPPPLQAAVLADAARAAGLAFTLNPIVPGGLTMAHLDAQREAITDAQGPVLAYCASGTRSAMVWALTEAGARPVDDILAATERGGYALAGLRPQIEALAAQG